MLETTRPKHFDELDSLRGIAAVTVMLHHWNIAWGLGAPPRRAAVLLQVFPFKLLTTGHASVLMFFVLSGFVLALPQIRGRSVGYPAYLAKRICRIYIPYLVVLGLAVALSTRFHGMRTLGPWVAQVWPSSPTFGSVLRQAFLIDNFAVAQYNISTWTLVHEMRISLIFPFLCALVLRLRIRTNVLLVAALLAVGSVVELHSLYGSLGATISYSAVFVLGILLAARLPQLMDGLARMPGAVRWTILLVALLVYAYAPTLLFDLHRHSASWDMLIAIPAALIILFALSHAGISTALLHPSLQFLGRISYSLYLLHGVLLFACLYLFTGRINPVFWLLPYLAATVSLAALSHRFLELPSIHWGRFLAQTLTRGRSPRGEEKPLPLVAR